MNNIYIYIYLSIYSDILSGVLSGIFFTFYVASFQTFIKFAHSWHLFGHSLRSGARG